jgi:hypothetical protein
MLPSPSCACLPFSLLYIRDHLLSVRFPPTQPQPWPLPPPRVVSTELDAATAFSPLSTVASDNPPDNSTIQETAMSLAKVEDVPALEADQSSALSASFEATDSGSNLPSSYQHSKAFNEQESESNVRPQNRYLCGIQARV